MSDLLLGLLFVFLDAYISFGDFTIGLIPDVAGYIFLISGLKKLSGKSPFFDIAKKWATWLAVFSAGTYIADLFALLADAPMVDWVLGAIATIGGIAISFFIVRAFRDVETAAKEDFQVHHLMTMWLATSAVRGLTYMINLMPLLNQISTLASIILTIVFLVAFHKTEKMAKPYL